VSHVLLHVKWGTHSQGACHGETFIPERFLLLERFEGELIKYMIIFNFCLCVMLLPHSGGLSPACGLLRETVLFAADW
jgi:hypothetical protein